MQSSAAGLFVHVATEQLATQPSISACETVWPVSVPTHEATEAHTEAQVALPPGVLEHPALIAHWFTAASWALRELQVAAAMQSIPACLSVHVAFVHPVTQAVMSACVGGDPSCVLHAASAAQAVAQVAVEGVPEHPLSVAHLFTAASYPLSVLQVAATMQSSPACLFVQVVAVQAVTQPSISAWGIAIPVSLVTQELMEAQTELQVALPRRCSLRMPRWSRRRGRRARGQSRRLVSWSSPWRRLGSSRAVQIMPEARSVLAHHSWVSTTGEVRDAGPGHGPAALRGQVARAEGLGSPRSTFQ
jgi:hypothetical protein